MKIFRLMLVVSLAALAMPALTFAGVIDFEGFPDGTVFTTQNFGDGVTFAGAQILSQGGSLNYTQFPPHSGINVVYNPSGPMTLTFTTPVDFFSGYFTYNDGMTITAYDSSSALIATVNGACSANYVGSTCGAPNEFLTVTDPGMISSVTITGGSGNNFTLDDASFTGSINAGAVPEPGTISLLLGGLGCFAYFGRRKRII